MKLAGARWYRSTDDTMRQRANHESLEVFRRLKIIDSSMRATHKLWAVVVVFAVLLSSCDWWCTVVPEEKTTTSAAIGNKTARSQAPHSLSYPLLMVGKTAEKKINSSRAPSLSAGMIFSTIRGIQSVNLLLQSGKARRPFHSVCSQRASRSLAFGNTFDTLIVSGVPRLPIFTLVKRRHFINVSLNDHCILSLYGFAVFRPALSCTLLEMKQ